MPAKHFIVATTGHVDHGKSALVKALTGVDPDRLPEEKKRGITIDLGFGFLELPAGDEKFELGIVDVPGHEDFVKNMVAGVGSIDLALFVVAADDGWMPQTEEHLQILTYLGVKQAVIALTKADLLPAAGEKATEQLREQLVGTPFSQAPLVKTSTLTGQGIEELKTAIVNVLRVSAPAPDIGKPRLPIDRVFALRGIGTVVTGTLTGGCLARGQSAVIQPGVIPTRVRSLQTRNCDVTSCGPGTRTAVNITDVEVANRVSAAATTSAIHRGQVVTVPELGDGAKTIDVLLARSERLQKQEGGAARPIKNGARVWIHHGSSSAAARIQLLDHKSLEPAAEGLAELRLETPLFAFAGDRFIVRDWAGRYTLAGGVVLDAEAERKRFRTEAQRQFLVRRSQPSAGVEEFLLAELQRDRAVRAQVLLRRSIFGPAEIQPVVTRLQQSARIVANGEWLLDATFWNGLRETALGAIDAQHRSRPELAGLPLNELRSLLEKSLPHAVLFDLLLADLVRSGCAHTGAMIRRTSHRQALPAALQGAGNRIRAALLAKPVEPPSKKELAPEPNSMQALRFLKETGEVIELSDEVVVLAEQFMRMKNEIARFITQRGPATVSELRQHLGTTRRIMMPLLERLDKDGVTVRQGDQRSLGKRGVQ